MEPIESPWKKLFVHADANTFLHMTGLSRPDGKVFFAAINFPESWADGSWTSVFCIMLLGEKVRPRKYFFLVFGKESERFKLKTGRIVVPTFVYLDCL